MLQAAGNTAEEIARKSGVAEGGWHILNWRCWLITSTGRLIPPYDQAPAWRSK